MGQKHNITAQGQRELSQCEKMQCQFYGSLQKASAVKSTVIKQDMKENQRKQNVNSANNPLHSQVFDERKDSRFA